MARHVYSTFHRTSAGSDLMHDSESLFEFALNKATAYAGKIADEKTDSPFGWFGQPVELCGAPFVFAYYLATGPLFYRRRKL